MLQKIDVDDYRRRLKIIIYAVVGSFNAVFVILITLFWGCF